MPVNEALLHNWFYGNYWVRVAGALSFSLLLSSIPIGAVFTWLFDGMNPRYGRTAARLVPPLNALKGFVPTIIAYHGGGLLVGLGAAAVAIAGHYFTPWRRFRGGNRIDALLGIAVALSPPSALMVLGCWGVCRLAGGSPAMGTLLGAAILFLPLWFFLGVPGALIGALAAAAVALRLFGEGEVS